MASLTLDDLRRMADEYVPIASRHPNYDPDEVAWWPAHEIGHLLTVPRGQIGQIMFGLDHAAAKRGRAYSYELAAMDVSRRLVVACGRPDLASTELSDTSSEVFMNGSESYARRIIARCGLRRLPHGRRKLAVCGAHRAQDRRAMTSQIYVGSCASSPP